MPLLELQNVSKAFGGLQVITGLDFHVDEHEIVSVIGPNGAGKTTLFNLVTGVYAPDDGEILFDGQTLIGLPPHKITQRGVARTFQTLRLFLKYGPHGEKLITGVVRISRPGRRVYFGRDDVPEVLAGLGTSILTTSRGVMTGRAAVKAGVGGEVLCNVW